jgi:signal peptidase I
MLSIRTVATRLNNFLITKTGIFLLPIVLSILSILFLPVASASILLLSIILIIYRTIKTRGNKLKALFVSLIIVITSTATVRTYITEARYIIGNSMSPTIPDQTRVVVDKISYIASRPKTGDIVIIKHDVIVGRNGPKHINQPQEVSVGRIIAAPSDKVEIKEGITWVNNKRLPESYNRTLSNSVTDKPLILEDCQMPNESNQLQQKLCFYMMSSDISDLTDYNGDSFTLVAEQNIVGKVKAKFWPMDRIGNIGD